MKSDTDAPLGQRVVPRSGTALHHQMYRVLRDRILRGDPAPGAALPNEATLAEQFGVSRVTVRRAVADLERDGLVKRLQGKGTFVQTRAEDLPPKPTLGLLDYMRQAVLDTEVDVIDVRSVLPDPAVREQLDLAIGEKAVRAIRRRLIGGVPVMLTHAWIAPHVGSKITAEVLRKRAVYEVLMSEGVRFGRVIQEISATSADPEQALRLETQVSAPLITLTRLLHDTNSRPVQFLEIYLAPERTRVLMDIAGHQINTLAGGHLVHNVQPRREERAGPKAK